jgi:hypothetical protein
MKRGDYHVAKEIMCMGPGLIVQEIKDSGREAAVLTSSA